MEQSLAETQLSEEDLTLFYEVSISIQAIRDLDIRLQRTAECVAFCGV